MMDFGYPQTTESKILQEYITQESHKLEVQARPPIAVTNAVSWRSEGIRYRKNEVFLDVVESLNLFISSNGNVLRSEILGAIKMKCYLSGMPELRLGLNDKVMFETTGRTTRGKAIEMEDVKFHQCVRLSRFENDRTISFIPPDGEFELMSYRLNTQVKPLIWVDCVVESHSGSRIEYMLKAKAQFKRRRTANNVEIIVPVPDDADSPRFRTNIGSVHYAPEQSAIVWKIKQFGGQKEFLMRAELGLPSVRGDDEHGGGMTGGFGGSMGGVGAMGKGAKRPIQVKFEIPYFTTSGIQVRYLKITEPKASRPPRRPPPPPADAPLTRSAAPVSLPAVGSLHHPVGRHCRPPPRRRLSARLPRDAAAAGAARATRRSGSTRVLRRGPHQTPAPRSPHAHAREEGPAALSADNGRAPLRFRGLRGPRRSGDRHGGHAATRRARFSRRARGAEKGGGVGGLGAREAGRGRVAPRRRMSDQCHL